MEPFNLHFDSWLTLTTLVTATWAGDVVDSINVYGRSLRNPNNPSSVANKKDSEGLYDIRYVYMSLKYSAFGNSASVSLTKVCWTSKALATTWVPAPSPILSDQNSVPVYIVRGLKGKETIKKKMKIQSQQVPKTCDTASCAMRELSIPGALMTPFGILMWPRPTQWQQWYPSPPQNILHTLKSLLYPRHITHSLSLIVLFWNSWRWIEYAARGVVQHQWTRSKKGMAHRIAPVEHCGKEA